jgi:hypothetical protein
VLIVIHQVPDYNLHPQVVDMVMAVLLVQVDMLVEEEEARVQQVKQTEAIIQGDQEEMV